MKTKRTYGAVVDESARTATISVYENGTLISQYLTGELTSEEIEWLDNGTSSDIYNYIKCVDNYKRIK